MTKTDTRYLSCPSIQIHLTYNQTEGPKIYKTLTYLKFISRIILNNNRVVHSPRFSALLYNGNVTFGSGNSQTKSILLLVHKKQTIPTNIILTIPFHIN